MKKQSIIFWSTTILFSAMMFIQGVAYLSVDFFKEAFNHLGFPSYFRVELAFAKLIGSVVLLVPAINSRYKEWAYAGFGITLISGFIAHYFAGDGVDKWSAPLIVFVLLALSYVFYQKRTGK